MTAPKKISLRQQVEAVRFAETRQRTLLGGGSVREGRPTSQAEYDMQRLNAAARTLEWLQPHEDDIRKLLALDAKRRAVLWDHMGDVVELLDRLVAAPDLGWKLVPAEPTKEMLDAVDTAYAEFEAKSEGAWCGAASVYRAMLAACPSEGVPE